MTPYGAVVYSFFFGLLHGVLPDEHTWPITLSYAIGTSRGREGMRAGLYFSSAFTFQRMVLAEASYLALAPFLLNPRINSYVYLVVGAAMSVAGAVVLRGRGYPHLHLLGRHGADRATAGFSGSLRALPIRWTLIHGFIAGFGVGGFALFVNTVAVPAMRSPWIGFLPGLSFGLGTTLMLVVLGGLFSRSLRLFHSLTSDQVRSVGRQVGARTLFFGGLFFAALGAADRLGLTAGIPDKSLGYVTIGGFLVFIVVPALIYSIRKVRSGA
jgi:hypothetical protein